MVRRIKASATAALKAATFTAEDVVTLLKEIPALDGTLISVGTTPQGMPQFTIGDYIYAVAGSAKTSKV